MTVVFMRLKYIMTACAKLLRVRRRSYALGGGGLSSPAGFHLPTRGWRPIRAAMSVSLPSVRTDRSVLLTGLVMLVALALWWLSDAVPAELPSFLPWDFSWIDFPCLALPVAAETLHVSASAINRQILLAEQTMETPLFERLPTGLKLTSAGEMLFDDIKRWRKEFIRTRERFDEMQGLRRGHVSISIIAALSEGMVAQLIADVGKEFPYLTFNIRIEESRNISEHVSSSEVDFGLLLDPVEHTGLEVRAFAELPIGIAMPVGHPLAHRKMLSFSDITEYRQIIPAEPLMINARAKLLYNRYQLHETPSIVCNDVRMMRELIRKGAGVGVLSLLDVFPDLQEKRLAFVPLQGHSVKPLTLALCVAPRRQLSRAAQIVIQKMIVMMESIAL